MPVYRRRSQAPWNRAVRIRTREWRAWLRADPRPALARPRAALDLAAAGAAACGRSCSSAHAVGGEPPPPARPPRRVDLERRAPAAGPGRPAALRARPRAGRGAACRSSTASPTAGCPPTSRARSRPPSCSGSPARRPTRAGARSTSATGRATRSTSSTPSESPPGSAASTSPAETWPQLQARVAAAVDELRGEDVLVVTHGGCIRAATAHLTGADARAARAARQRQPDRDRARRPRAPARATGCARRARRRPGLRLAHQRSDGSGRARPPRAGRRGATGSRASAGGAGGGRVSRRNCSIAAITAAASSGEALEPCSSRRGRRFTTRADVAVLALRARLALGQQRLERGDDLRPRLVRDDHVVDVAALGRRVGVGEARLVVVDQLLAALVGRRRLARCRGGG